MRAAAAPPVRRRTLSRAAHVLLLLALVVVPVTAAVESTSGGATVQLAAEADARVDAKYPDTNFGSSSLRVDLGSTPEESFVRFVVSEVGVVERATFRFHSDSASADGVQVYAATNEWAETAVTWNGRPAKGAALTTTGAIADDTWVDIDVSSVVRGAGTYTLALVPTTSDGLDIDSRETGAGPQLVLQTKQPAPSAPAPSAPAPPPPPPSPAPSDTKPPTTPTNLQMTGATATSITLSWSASTDDVGVAGYDLYRNGTRIASTRVSPYTFTGLTCGTTYTLGVEALDAANNRSSRAQLSAATSPCASPPPPPPPDDYNGNPCVYQPWPAGSLLPNRIPDSQGSVIHVSTSAQYRSALASVNPGQTIRLAPGRYGAGETVYSVTRSGTPTAPITIEGTAVGSTIIDTSHTVTASWLRFRNFEIDGTSRSFANGFWGKSGSNVEVCGLYIHDQVLGAAYAQCVFTSGAASRYHFINLRLERCGSTSNPEPRSEHGMYLYGSHFLVANVLMLDPSGYGAQLYGALFDSLVVHITAVGSKTTSGIIQAGSSDRNKIVNSIAARNKEYGFRRDVGVLDASFLIAHANPAGNYLRVTGTNLSTADPLLGSNQRPQAGSPAVGHVDSRYTPHFDLSGRARGSRAAAGALEP